jgi:hypothetical protein
MLGATPAETTWATPTLRTFEKNHRRSRRIGPPRPKLESQFFRTVGGAPMPSARTSSSTLLFWKRELVPL